MLLVTGVLDDRPSPASAATQVDLTVEKVTLGATGLPVESSQLFTIVADAGSSSIASLSLDTAPGTTTPDTATTTLDAGLYTIREIIPAGWVLESVSCDAGNASPDGDGVLVDLDGATRCTFTNRIADSIELTVIKETVDAAGLPISTNDVFAIDLVDPLGAVTPLAPLDTDASTIASDRDTVAVPAGVYKLVETPPPGWALRSIECNGTDVPLVAGIAGEISAQVGITTAKTCTVTNSLDGAMITIIKRTIDASGAEIASGRNFDFEISRSGILEKFNLDTDPLSEPGASNTVLGPPGAYKISEQLVEGWAPIDVRCDGEPVTLNRVTPFQKAARAEATIEAAGMVTCVFTNQLIEDLQIVTIVKRTVDGNGLSVETSQAFSITIDGAFVDETLVLDTDPGTATPERAITPQFAAVATLSEAPPAGWELLSIVCDGVPLDLRVVSAGAPLDLRVVSAGAIGGDFVIAGELTCIVTNRQSTTTSAPGLTLIMRTLDDAGSEIEVDDLFVFTVTDFLGPFAVIESLDTEPLTAIPDRVTLDLPQLEASSSSRRPCHPRPRASGGS